MAKSNDVTTQEAIDDSFQASVNIIRKFMAAILENSWTNVTTFQAHRREIIAWVILVAKRTPAIAPISGARQALPTSRWSPLTYYTPHLRPGAADSRSGQFPTPPTFISSRLCQDWRRQATQRAFPPSATRMRATPCLARGFWGRSMDELKRYTKIAMNLEGIKGASGPYELFSFRDQESMKECAPFSDADIGGFSKVQLDWVPPNERANPLDRTRNPHGHARFHGSISIQLPKNRRHIERSGYAAWKTYDRPPTIFGRSLWDIDPYTYLALRVKSDGRSYLINVQTESIEPTDLHQHRLFTTRKGEWETVLISWNDFVRTNHGWVTEPQGEMLRQKVRTIGIGLTDRVPGPFELCIERIWATNDRGDADLNEAEAAAVKAETAAWKEGQLKNKEGKSINWVDD